MTDAEARRRVRAIVRGRVQDVAFRAATAARARREGVAGWVRNRSDGSVEMVFEGDPARVEALLDFARQGPPLAHVEDVQTHEETPQSEREFLIRG